MYSVRARTKPLDPLGDKNRDEKKWIEYQLFSQNAAAGKKKKKKKKIQTEHPLFESSTVLLARYLQLGIQIRSNVFWKTNSSQRSNCRGTF